MAGLKSWRERARVLKREVVVLYFAVRDPRTPLIAKVIAAAVVAYALSPIDLIPDFIPVIGYLDDLVLIPLFILIARRLIPPDLLAEHRERARARENDDRRGQTAAVIIVSIWVLVVLVVAVFLWRRLR
jgi:uncharacterized membrane protein YkvA (DUF1232 family)